MDKFYEVEMKGMFEQCPITIKMPLIQELTVEESKAATSDHSEQLERVKGYGRLQKIEEFQDSFVLGLNVYAVKFERPILLVEESVQAQCIELIKTNVYNFQNITITLHEQKDTSNKVLINQQNDDICKFWKKVLEAIDKHD